MAHLSRVGLFVLISLATTMTFSPPADAQSSLRKEISDLKKKNRDLELRLRKLENVLIVTSTQVKIKKLLIDEDLNVGGNLSVGSDASFGRNVSAGGNVSVGGNLSVGKSAAIANNLSSGGDLSGLKNIRLNGDIKIKNRTTLKSSGITSKGTYTIKTSGRLKLKGTKITQN